MSISVINFVNIPQAALKFVVEDNDAPPQEYRKLGGVLSDSDYAWLSEGPRLQIVHTKTGNKVGAWTFGWVLKAYNTEVICVHEIQRPNGRLPLLAVGIDGDFSGGMICIFDFISSKILRAIQTQEKITTLHVIDSGDDVFTLPGPLRNFDGIIALGTAGGNVYLVDICRQSCDEALTVAGLNEIRDELNPTQVFTITSRDFGKIEHHKEFAVTNSQHLAIHLNVVFEKSTEHFVLKGPKGEDRSHANKDEVTVSALYYCAQLGSLLVGYNFGALQLYNLINFQLVYTSPVCDEHIPISHFAFQEPADDPKAVCYIWAVYSVDEEYPTCLPLAVMYAFSYHTKEYHEGYGCLYQDFSSAAVHFQMELGVPFGHDRASTQRGGNCIRINSINHGLSNRDGLYFEPMDDNLTLCVFVWEVWFSNKTVETLMAIFDLNQWYKEQMPNVPKGEYYSTYMLHISPNDLINSATNKSAPILDIYLNGKSLQQFRGSQKLEEHFHPNSLSFTLTCLREGDVFFLRNYGVQKALLAQIESSGPLCLVEPAQIYQEVVGLGLVPLFVDLPINAPVTTNQQREIILGAALENHLVGWLCKCASEWANGSFLSAGCSLDFLISWAFQKAIVLKSNCDRFCVPLFDYSGVKLDNNTTMLLNRCRRQLKTLCSLYGFIMKKLSPYISNFALVDEQFKSLETVSIYFEVLQWLLNVGLLPECSLSAYPLADEQERISAPFPAEMMVEFYNHRRALLKILNEENFSSSDSVLFIDALIERECGGNTLQEEWRNDGGNGLYPPPSLQALLRTYLIDDVNIFYKHSVIIYVFLDLAMALDQEKYKLVITQLIKFPAVFKVSPSLIKITQGFWQLDHSDFNTAMGLLLDPLVSPEDLTEWHHSIVLRALMLQKQHNFALYYVQARKPVLKETDDILTAISLYVANNMIDEAFYFVNAFPTENKQFLLYLFNECKKSKKLRSLIYRTQAFSDENTFLKYLTNANESVAEDLNVYYHILRSDFIKAFDSHDRSVPNQIAHKGLQGQEHAIPRDKLVSCLKKLLPNVKGELQTHKAYQRVSKPTPMTVVVNHFTENVQYKSNVIGSALGKIHVERTPHSLISSSKRRHSSIIVNPRVINVDADDDSTPAIKRLKLSPGLNSTLSTSIASKLDTPLVKRKTPKARDSREGFKQTTPHSILKVKSFVNTPNQKSSNFEDDFKEFERLEYTPVSSQTKKGALGLSPRKSLAKSSPVVRFEGLKSTSSSSLNNTRSSFDKSSSINSSHKLSLSPAVNKDSKEIRESLSPKNTSTEDELFYSPNSSLENEEVVKQVEKEEKVAEPVENNEEMMQDTTVTQENMSEAAPVATPVSLISDQKDAASEEKLNSSRLLSPRGRRSYKRSLEPSTPVRSSPRLSRNASLTNDSVVSSPGLTPNEKASKESLSEDPSKPAEEDSTSLSDSPNSSPGKLKLRPRKSLCRQVLETNALNRVFSSPQDSPRKRKSKGKEISVTKVEASEKVVLESTIKYEDGEETQESSMISKHSVVSSFAETDSSDVSIEMECPTGPKISDSMLAYIRGSYNTVSANNTIDEESNKKNFNSAVITSTPKNSATEASFSVDSPKEKMQLNESEKQDSKTTFDGNGLVQSQSVLESEKSEITSPKLQDTDVSFGVNSTDGDRKVSYSVFETSSDESFSFSSGAQGPELSKSMVQYLKSVNTPSEEVEQMEVDDETNMEESKTTLVETRTESVYTTLTSNHSETVEETTNTLLYVRKRQQKKNYESFQGDNRSVDPEMNVFEISDDLSLNDGIVIEKEVTLEEKDLCYGQENTLENVLERNISTTTTDMNVFEKNMNDIYECSEEVEIQEASTDQKSIDQIAEDEVIEIGSSSDESNVGREDNSSISESWSRSSNYGEESDVNVNEYEANIYESDGDHTSTSSYERPYSALSENTSEPPYETIKEGCGLFEGDILVEDEKDGEQDNKNNVAVDLEEKHPEDENEADDENVNKIGEDSSVEMDELIMYSALESDTEKIPAEVYPTESKFEDNVENNKPDLVNNQIEEVPDNTEVISKDQIETENAKTKPPAVILNNHLENLVPEEVVDDLPATTNKMEVVENPSEGDSPSKGEVSEEISNKSPEQNLVPIEEKPDSEMVEHLATSQISNDTPKDAVPLNIDPLPSTVAFELSNSKQSATEVSEEASNKTEKGPEQTVDRIVERPADAEIVKVASQEISKDAVPSDIIDPLPATIAFKLSNTKQGTAEVLENDTKNVPSTPVGQNLEDVVMDSGNLKPSKSKETKKSRSRSASESSTTSTRSRRKSITKEDETPKEVLLPKRRTRKTSADTEKQEADVEKSASPPKPERVLRSRRISADEPPARPKSLRKRSASVDEVASNKQSVEPEVQNDRSRRAKSVLSLPRIPEEDKKDQPEADSSSNRRMTRRQLNQLNEHMDPVVVLDRLSTEKKPDTDKQNLKDDGTPSTSGSPVKLRRTRSTSQSSEPSQRSKSKTPVRSLKSPSKADVPKPKSSKKKLEEISEAAEEDDVVPPSRRTRSRTNSVSSVHSDDSHTSGASTTSGRRRRKLFQEATVLPEIQEEEPDKSVKSTVPKKRTRKTSSS